MSYLNYQVLCNMEETVCMFPVVIIVLVHETIRMMQTIDRLALVKARPVKAYGLMGWILQ